jgi:hypothetical protein
VTPLSGLYSFIRYGFIDLTKWRREELDFRIEGESSFFPPSQREPHTNTSTHLFTEYSSYHPSHQNSQNNTNDNNNNNTENSGNMLKRKIDSSEFQLEANGAINNINRKSAKFTTSATSTSLLTTNDFFNIPLSTSDKAPPLCSEFTAPVVLKHPFKLYSAYERYSVPPLAVVSETEAMSMLYIPPWSSTESTTITFEPRYTSYTSRFKGTIDYIFLTQDLKCQQVLKLPPSRLVRQQGGIPHLGWGSDHYALMAKIEMKIQQKQKKTDQNNLKIQNSSL